LILKLEALGFNGEILKWIEAFLTGRRQRVVIGEITSEWKKVISGVPQGSVLGPLLFIIFINDMPSLTKHISKFFADDSKVIGIIKNSMDKILLQNDLDTLVNWSKEWKMCFNYDKCKVMCIKKNKSKNTVLSKTPKISDYTMEIFGNDERHKLEETQVERDLGIQLSDDLKWHTQAITAANKANSVLGINEQLSIGMKIFASSCTSLMYVRILSTQHQRGTHIE
jgi:hypothetical protein